jgi:hypothetical protein
MFGGLSAGVLSIPDEIIEADSEKRQAPVLNSANISLKNGIRNINQGTTITQNQDLLTSQEYYNVMMTPNHNNISKMSRRTETVHTKQVQMQVNKYVHPS